MHAIFASTHHRDATSSFARGVLKAATAAALVLAVGTANAQLAGNKGPASLFVQKQASNKSAPATSGSDVISVMVELTDAPAAITYAESLKASLAHAGATSLSSLTPAARLSATQAASVVARSQATTIESAQRSLLPTLNKMSTTGAIVYRTKSVYNGISLYVRRDQVEQLRALPGVKDVHIQIPKFINAATDIDFLGARAAWALSNGSFPDGIHGEGIKIADIDTGLDYIHTNFGGPGTPAAYATVTDTVANPAYFPSAKVPGGTDLAGDAYTGSNTPHPDSNPMDSSNGHGTATASLIGGLGVNSDGSTYTGTYDSGTDISSMRISPGFAPAALLYPIRVFGVSGSTNLVTEAINYAVDPNNDGSFVGRVDVINMSLGADTGDPDDSDAVAASNATAVGTLVAAAAGNAGDTYYIVSSPSVGNGVLSVAASFNDTGGYYFDSNVTVNSPTSAVDPSIYGSPNGHVGAGGLTGNVVYANPPTGSADGVSPLLNAAAISGNICLIDRGVIGFANKVKLCQDAGATATIVVQSAAGSGSPNPIPMSLTGPPTSTIPAVMIGLAEGQAIETALQSGPVNVTINNDNGFVSQSTTAGDTMTSYSSRGPRSGDSMLKPDITAPAEVVGVAHSLSGNQVESFNGTSSATPHISGIMALLRQLHPTWSVEELNALVMATATHDLFTGGGGTGNQYGAGRVGAGRVDVSNAISANVVAYNRTDPDLISVSFGVVEAPVFPPIPVTLTKNITLSNKGSSDVTYNVSFENATPLSGTQFLIGNGAPITVGAGNSVTVPVVFQAMGNSLVHLREASVPLSLPSARQWLTESTGYAVFTPTDSSPVLRVALYAAPKPVSTMKASPIAVTTNAVTGKFNVNLTGTPVNTGSAFPTDIVSLAKPFELGYTSFLAATPFEDPAVIKYAGATSDYATRGANTVISFAYQTFGTNTTPDFAPGEKDVYFDVNGDGNADYVIYFSSLANGTDGSNAYRPVLVNLSNNLQTTLPIPTDLLQPNSRDVNAFNNSVVTFAISAATLHLAGASQPTKFSYEIVSFYRDGSFADDTGLINYDLAKPGFEVDGGKTEPFYYNDVPLTSIAVNYNGVNAQLNDSQGVMMVHMHNAGGNAQVDTVPFTPPIADLFWRHHDDVNIEWLMNGATATSVRLPDVSGPGWVMGGVGDIDGDGRGDLVWYYQPTGDVYVWLMSGSGVKEVVSLGEVGPGWTMEAVADLNGDGVADILWRHSTGVVYAWYLASDVSVGDVVALGMVATPDWRVAGTGNFDGNATKDIIWSYEVPGPFFGTPYAWLMDPNEGVSSVVAVPVNAGKFVAKVGDFDGDGMTDLLWRDDTSGNNEVWYMNGLTSSLVQPMPNMATGWQAAATGDFDSNGKTDLLWLLPSSGAVMEWLMNGRGVAPTVNNLGSVGPNWYLPGQ